jgi:hypothetical protein
MIGMEFFDNVFEEPVCRFLLANSRASLSGSSEFRRSNFHWQPELRQSSAVVLVRDIEPVLSGLLLDKLIERKIVEHREYRVMNFAWTRLSYIPWHDDYRVKDAVTIFLNDVWELDWGGLFLYQDEATQILGYPPTFNCGLRNQGNVLHATTPVSLEAPEPRFTLQLFSQRQLMKGESSQQSAGH